MSVVPSVMPSKQPMLHIVMGDERLDRIDEWQHRHRFSSRSAAFVALVDWALDQDPDIEAPRRRPRIVPEKAE